MLGNGFVHVIQESYEYVAAGKISSMTVSVLMLGGYFLSFLLHKVMHLHCHHMESHTNPCDETQPHDEHKHEDGWGEAGHIHPNGQLSLLSHGVDNFTDGILIGLSFIASIPTGLAMTWAIMMHEVPMELGGFGVLVKAGFSKRKAVLINFLSGIVAVAGTSLVLAFASVFSSLPVILTPIGAGVVIYFAASGLVPQLQKETDKRKSLYQVLLMALGAGFLVLCKYYGG
jgi:zinc and cadmium transporter